MRLHLTVLTLVTCLLVPGMASAACARASRTAVYQDQPVVINADKHQYAEVIFPQPLAAILPEQPAGLNYHQGAFPDRLFFQVTSKTYHGDVIIETQKGKTYRLKLLARFGCADGTVHVVDAQRPAAKQAVSKDDGGEPGKQQLIKYMLRGETPDGYRQVKAEGAPRQRLVLKMGSVYFYLDQIWKGPGDTGLILLAVNQGRTPFRVAVNQIEFDSKRMRKTFGRVRQITMMPSDFRLDPAPEYASSALHAKNKGLVYIVANHHRRR